MVKQSPAHGVVLCAILLLSAVAVVHAQQQIYPLARLTEAAKAHLPALKARSALTNSARAAVTETRHSFLPQLQVSEQLNLGTDNSLPGSYLPMGPNPSSSAGIRSTNNAQPASGNFGVLYGQYDLVTFGLNRSRLQYAQANVLVQQAAFENEQYELIARLAVTYFELLKTRYRLLADQYNVNRYDSIYTIINALANSGIKPGADAALARAELSKARITLNETEGAVEDRQEQVAYLTGIPATQLVIDSLADYFKGSKIPEIALPTDSMKHPLLDYYSQRVSLLAANDKVINKSFLPRIVLGVAGWARGSSISDNDVYKSLPGGWGYQRFNYMGALTVNYNLFSARYRRDRLAINRLEQEASEYDLSAEREGLLLAARRAAADLRTQNRNLAEMPVQLQAAQETYQQKLAQYKAGIISLIDLTNASFVLYRAQTDFIEVLGNWYLAQLDNAAATGKLYAFIQLIK